MNKLYLILLISVSSTVQIVTSSKPSIFNKRQITKQLKKGIKKKDVDKVLKLLKEMDPKRLNRLINFPTLASRQYVSAKTPSEKHKSEQIILFLLRYGANFDNSVTTKLPPSEFIGIAPIIAKFKAEEGLAASALVFGETKKNLTLITNIAALLES